MGLEPGAERLLRGEGGREEEGGGAGGRAQSGCRCASNFL